MNSKTIFKITTQISEQSFSESAIQANEQVAVGVNADLGLYVLAFEPTHNDQSISKKCIEIIFDDMDFNLSNQPSLTATNVSNCLHESLENLNEYLIDQNQSASNQLIPKGVSLAVIQTYPEGLVCSFYGDMCCLQVNDDAFTFINPKVSLGKSLGINPNLTISTYHVPADKKDSIFVSSCSLINQLDPNYIRLTFARFKDNLAMLTRQLHSRATKNNITDSLSFIIAQPIQTTNVKKGWFN